MDNAFTSLSVSENRNTIPRHLEPNNKKGPESLKIQALRNGGGNADLPQNSLKAHAPCNFLIINDELI